jgi:hypothetical protein
MSPPLLDVTDLGVTLPTAHGRLAALREGQPAKECEAIAALLLLDLGVSPEHQVAGAYLDLLGGYSPSK